MRAPRITSKLSDLQFYQLAIPSPQPPPNSFDQAAALVDHYDTCMNLNLASGEKSDLVQYLLSLTF